MGLDPVTQFVITLALAFGSAAYQQAQVRRARRKLRSQLENLAGVDIRTTPAAQVVPICYGATAAPGIPVYAQTANILPATTARGFGTLGQSPGIDPEGGDPIPSPDINREQKFRSYLLTQNVLCKGGIEGLLDIHLDDKPWDTDKIKQIVSHEFRQGTASPAATAFTDERTAEDVFAGLGFVTGLYKYDTEDPVFGGPPFLFGFVHGRKVPTVVQTGTTFALSGNNTYSPNAVRCFLDYLTGPDGGPLETADLDLGAFHAAEALAERIVQGSGSAIWSHGYPAYLNNLNGTGYSTWSAFFMDHGFTGEDDSGLGDWHGGGIPVLRRYEANGNISSTRNWPDAIDQFLEVMPGAQFWRGYDGTYKLRLPRADVAAADQSVMTITPSHLYGPIKTSYPDASVKVNQLTGRFANVQLDMASDTVTWPAEGTAPYTQLRQADGLVRLHDTVPLELTNNPYHAADILSTQVLLSRRPVHQLPMRPQAFLLEPGDIVKIEDPAVELDEYAMVLQVSVGQDLRITVEVRQFNPLDFAYITADKVARALRPATDLSTGILQDVRLSVVHGVPRLIRLGWDIPETRTAIRRYEIETATFDAEPDADTERAWRFAAFVPGAQTSHDHIIGDAAAWYQFRVRVIDELEVAGEWQTSNVVSVAALNVADLPGGLSVPDLPVPPAPQALDVLCGFTFCGLDWINPFRLYQDHARTVIFRGTTDVFADAVQIGTANYLTYFDTTVEAETTYYYWAAHENTSDDRGPVAGPVSASTAIDVEALRNSILQGAPPIPATGRAGQRHHHAGFHHGGAAVDQRRAGPGTGGRGRIPGRADRRHRGRGAGYRAGNHHPHRYRWHQGGSIRGGRPHRPRHQQRGQHHITVHPDHPAHRYRQRQGGRVRGDRPHRPRHQQRGQHHITVHPDHPAHRYRQRQGGRVRGDRPHRPRHQQRGQHHITVHPDHPAHRYRQRQGGRVRGDRPHRPRHQQRGQHHITVHPDHPAHRYRQRQGGRVRGDRPHRPRHQQRGQHHITVHPDHPAHRYRQRQGGRVRGDRPHRPRHQQRGQHHISVHPDHPAHRYRQRQGGRVRGDRPHRPRHQQRGQHHITVHGRDHADGHRQRPADGGGVSVAGGAGGQS